MVFLSFLVFVLLLFFFFSFFFSFFFPFGFVSSLSFSFAFSFAFSQILTFSRSHSFLTTHPHPFNKKGERLNTLQGSPVIFTRPAGTTNLHINNALVLTTDQLASNGLLDIIDTLIIPVPLASAIGGLPPTVLPGAHAHM